MWCAKLPALQDQFPGSKVIACVRNVAWIMDSIERQFRSKPYENTKLLGGNMARSTLYQRLEGLAQRDQLVGFAWAALREAFYGEHAKHLLVVNNALLAQAPEQVMKLIYDFIGQPHFVQDFEQGEYDAPDVDLQLSLSGLHRVKPKVAFAERRTIISPDLFEKFSKMTFWTDPSGNTANVIAPKPPLKDATA